MSCSQYDMQWHYDSPKPYVYYAAMDFFFAFPRLCQFVV